MTTPRPTNASADPTTPPAWTWWKGYDGIWYVAPSGDIVYQSDEGIECNDHVYTVKELDIDRGPRLSPDTCPARPRPTTDPASRAIAAHTTPGKTGEDSPTTPTPEEVWAIIDAVPRGSAHVALAMERYGLRVYHNGAEFAIRSMTNG